MDAMRLAFDEIKSEIKRVLVKYGMPEEKAETCARIHTETAYDGVYSHGTNRVARFVNYIQKGWVDVNAEPSLEREFGALRVYNGNMGPGVLNALYCADRAMELADQYGIGMVGIRNTTHWMRGGTYGLYAARKGYAAIMWTNTESCMPPWGGRECRLGNNPFVMAVPSADGGEPLQLDMGHVPVFPTESCRLPGWPGEKLPYPGGFDDEGNLTDDPGAIEQSRPCAACGLLEGIGRFRLCWIS